MHDFMRDFGLTNLTTVSRAPDVRIRSPMLDHFTSDMYTVGYQKIIPATQIAWEAAETLCKNLSGVLYEAGSLAQW